MWAIFFIILSIVALSLGLKILSICFKKPKPKYRIGKKQGRAILEVETGHEYLIFPKGKEKEAKEYCNFLNSRNY